MSQEPLEDTNDVFNLGSTCTRVNTNEKSVVHDAVSVLESTMYAILRICICRLTGDVSTEEVSSFYPGLFEVCSKLVASEGSVFIHRDDKAEIAGIASLGRRG